MSDYAISRLEPEQIDLAYVLVQAAIPSLLLGDWRKFCRGAAGRIGDGDVVVATDSLGHIRGLAVASLRPHLIHRLALDISFFAVVSVVDERGIAAALVEYLLAHARTMRCGAVRFLEDSSVQWRSCPLPKWVLPGSDEATLLLRPSDAGR